MCTKSAEGNPKPRLSLQERARLAAGTERAKAALQAAKSEIEQQQQAREELVRALGHFGVEADADLVDLVVAEHDAHWSRHNPYATVDGITYTLVGRAGGHALLAIVTACKAKGHEQLCKVAGYSLADVERALVEARGVAAGTLPCVECGEEEADDDE